MIKRKSAMRREATKGMRNGDGVIVNDHILENEELCSRFYKGSRKFLNPYISAVPESLIFM